MEFYAHSAEGKLKEDWQKLKDHLTAVAALAEKYASAFGAGELARTAGLLHDIGKYSREFQEKLEGKNRRVDHSTAGAKEAEKFKMGRLISYAIAGHHAGLPDCCDIIATIKRDTHCASEVSAHRCRRSDNTC